MRDDIHKAAPPAVAGGAREAGTKASFREWLRGIARAYRQLIGIPDYEGYLAHMAERHPGEPVLSRREFCAQAIDGKYGKRGPRCC